MAAPISWHDASVECILERLGSNQSGLSTTEAADRMARCGPNSLPLARTRGPLSLLVRQISNTLPLVLLGSGLLALSFGRIVDGTVVVAVVVVNAIIGALQEYRAGRAIEALGALVPEIVTVLRDGEPSSVAAAELVPGDVVLVEAGNRVPADMRILAARNLRVAEAALTGESIPVVKQSDAVPKEAALGDRASMIFSGTIVTTGTATAVVCATGSTTELGRISAMLRGTKEIETPLTEALGRFGNILTAAIGGVAYFVLLTALRRGYPFVDAVRAAVSVVVAAVPSSLPAVITVALAVGVARMAKRNAIVRTLPAIETLGSTNVICSDKTGTLTRGEMVARAIWTGAAFYELSGAGYTPRGELLRDGSPVARPVPTDVVNLVSAATLCNDATLRCKDGAWTGVGDPTEVALLVAAMKVGVEPAKERARVPRLDAIPFDPAIKYMATLHGEGEGGKGVVVKGAPEVVLDLCDRFGHDAPFDRKEIADRVDQLAARGMRVLAVARCHADQSLERLDGLPKQSLELLGLIASMDPPRPEATAAIRICHEAGITVKMVTGDHPATAKAIGVEIGIAEMDDRAVLGEEIEKLNPGQFDLAVRFSNVFSRVAPEHKLRLVRALQSRGDVVAMTGDGVNDAPALKQADVGVAMGRGGTAAAKEAAAVILVDDNFASIAAAVEGGRRCYDSLVKALMFVVPTNLGQSLVLLLGVLFFPVAGRMAILPIVPLQILWVNLVTGVTLAIPLAFEAPEPDLMRRPPRPRHEPIFNPQLGLRCFLVGTVMGIGAVGLFLDEYYGVALKSHTTDVALRTAQTITATTIVLDQIVYLLQCRSLRTSMFSVNPLSNPAVYVGIAATLLMQLAFVYLPVMNTVFHSAPLGMRDWLACSAVATCILPVVAFQKMMFAKKQNWARNTARLPAKKGNEKAAAR